jgi:hypothetical protein
MGRAPAPLPPQDALDETAPRLIALIVRRIDYGT